VEDSSNRRLRRRALAELVERAELEVVAAAAVDGRLAIEEVVPCCSEKRLA
jgi:hypothetical protein